MARCRSRQSTQPTPGLVTALYAALGTIDARRLLLIQAEDALARLVSENRDLDRLLYQFWKAGGVTQDDFADWRARRGKWSQPVTVKTRGDLHLVK